MPGSSMKPPKSSLGQARTPRLDGFRMPAEWTPHEATWLAWPYDRVTWPNRVPKAEDVFIQMMRALTPHERVDLLVKDARMEEKVRPRLADEKIANVTLHRIKYVDSWIRDYGPTFVRDGAGRIAFVDWRFNAWGNKYDTLLKDDAIPPLLEPILGVPRYEANLVMEGGSIEVNGAGVVLTTEQCLLNPNRNPDLSRGQIEKSLREFLGVEKVLWLKDGVEGDDTDGHIDDLARFVGERTVVAAVEDDPKDANHAILRHNLQRLHAFTDARDRPLEIIEFPMPGEVDSDEGRLPASYANFYIGNGAVLLPTFGHANDVRAQTILERLFPGRRVVPIRCEDLVWGMGTLHCVSQQQPAAAQHPR